MKFLPLIWKNVWRRKFRTTFTLLSIFVAFLLFGLLMTIRAAFSLGVDIAGLDRLILIHKVSLIMPLPYSYLGRLQQTSGVELATQTWFNGIYQDPANFFANIAVEPEPFLKIYPEFRLPPVQVQAWLADRQGAIAGRDLAERFGWMVGDRIPLTGTIWQPKQGQLGNSTSSASTMVTTASTKHSSSSGTTIWMRTGPRARGS
jgi:putative ABC transport system permease protein